MNKYRFRIGDPHGVWAVFAVISESREKAVALANAALLESQLGSRLVIGTPLRDAYAFLEPGIQVDEGMIVEEEPVDFSELIQVHDWLVTQGFLRLHPRFLVEYQDPCFSKAMHSEDGASIYAFIEVQARWKEEIQAYFYQIKAVLYPVGVPGKRNRKDRLAYEVNFQNLQACTIAEELPSVLQAYEVKFRKLITALREADPTDGLSTMMPDGIA